MGTDTLQALHHAVDLAFAQRSAELAERAIELDRREADLAAAAELISLDARIAAAMAQGQAIERQRCLDLIAMRAQQFSAQSSTHAVLLNLKQVIAGVE